MTNRVVHVRCIFRRGTSDDERAFVVVGRRGVAPARYCSDRDLRPLLQPEPDVSVPGYLSGVHVDDTRDGRMRVYLPDGAVHAVEHDWVRATPTPAEAVAQRLRGIADRYWRDDARPGEHEYYAYVCWAIADILRGVADDIERGG